jgi:membrane associated rhomboid family serine protease
LWGIEGADSVIIPYATDAPIYHFPRATLGLIAANVGIYFLSVNVDPKLVEPHLMKLGSGIHPLQWLTHNFLHADIIHLLGNMIFLWAYGIIVEGKLGWWAMLLTYLGIGVAQGATLQLAYLAAEDTTYVLGASSGIFGLMAICMLWAPVNDISCFYLFIVGFRVISNTIDVPIYVFALLQIAFEGTTVLFQAIFLGTAISSALLHLTGAFWGLVAGALILKLGLVDCEEWDVFSLLAHRRKLRKEWKARIQRLELSKENEKVHSLRPQEDSPRKAPAERAAAIHQRAVASAKLGDAHGAVEAYEKWTRTLGDPPPREDLLGLIRAFHEGKLWAASVPMMRRYCRAHPQQSSRMALKLATVLIRDLERPGEALKVLGRIPAGSLPPELEEARSRLAGEAERLQQEGVLELEGEE